MFGSFFSKLFPKTDPVTVSDRQIGIAGEKAAADYLRDHGFRIIERNWRCRIGEIDLIGIDNSEYVIVEVKSSKKLGSLPPEFRVQAKKRRKLDALAELYMKSRAIDAPYRIDVISVWWENNHVQIRHIPNAYR